MPNPLSFFTDRVHNASRNPKHQKALLDFIKNATEDQIHNLRDESGNTMLHIVAAKGNILAIEALIARGADLGSVNNAGSTATMVASEAAAQFLQAKFAPAVALGYTEVHIAAIKRAEDSFKQAVRNKDLFLEKLQTKVAEHNELLGRASLAEAESNRAEQEAVRATSEHQQILAAKKAAFIEAAQQALKTSEERFAQVNPVLKILKKF